MELTAWLFSISTATTPLFFILGGEDCSLKFLPERVAVMGENLPKIALPKRLIFHERGKHVRYLYLSKPPPSPPTEYPVS